VFITAKKEWNGVFGVQNRRRKSFFSTTIEEECGTAKWTFWCSKLSKGFFLQTTIEEEFGTAKWFKIVEDFSSDNKRRRIRKGQRREKTNKVICYLRDHAPWPCL
jgi:hypothetical protein